MDYSNYVDYLMTKGLTGSHTFQDDNGIDEHHVVIYKCGRKIYGVEFRSVPVEEDYAYDDYRLRKGKKVINAEPFAEEVAEELEVGETTEEQKEQSVNKDIYAGLTQTEIRRLERKRLHN